MVADFTCQNYMIDAVVISLTASAFIPCYKSVIKPESLSVPA